MQRPGLALAVLALAAAPALAGKPKVRPSVQYATSWEAAIEEAQLLNLPIVVHGHGFY